MKDTTYFPQILWDSGRERAEQDCACSADVPFVAVHPPAGPEAETDCACAPAAVPLQAGLPEGRLWTLPPNLYRAPLPGGYQVAFSPTGPAGVVVLNGPAARLLDSFATPALLTDPAAQEMASLGLLQPVLPSPSRTPYPTARNPQPASHILHHVPRTTQYAIRNTLSTLTLWLHLTTRCNLRCAYCYAPRGETDMSPEVGRAAVDGALRSARAHGFPALKIKYAGGEPTLNLPTLQTVHEYARRRAAEAGLELREVVLTNGTTLTSALLRWLRDEEIRLSISLDGIGPAHDGQRASEDGIGSFARIAGGIERALALGIRPHLSVTVTAHNGDKLAEVVAFALDRGLPFNLNFVRPAPGRPDLTPEPARLIAALQSVIRNLQSATDNLQSAICNLLDRCDLSAPHRYPCGAGHAYIVVGPRGELARCHMEMERTVGTVWEEDPLAAVRGEDGFRNPPIEEKEGCRDCPWRYICAGGCPLTARQIVGREDRPSPYCAVYRAILPELLRLEGLRMMRAHSTP